MCLAFPSRHDRSLQIIPLNRSRFHSSSRLQFFSGFPSLFIFFWSFICHLHTDLKVQFILVLFKSINIHHFLSIKVLHSAWRVRTTFFMVYGWINMCVYVCVSLCWGEGVGWNMKMPSLLVHASISPDFHEEVPRK